MLAYQESIGSWQKVWSLLASAIEIIVHIFSVAFLVGAIGCVFVIPIVAFSLFSVLFEPDTTGEE